MNPTKKEILSKSWLMIEENEPVALWQQANGWGDIILNSGKHLGEYQRSMLTTSEGLKYSLYCDGEEWSRLGKTFIEKITVNVSFRKKVIKEIKTHADDLFFWNKTILKSLGSSTINKKNVLGYFVEGLRKSGELYSWAILPVYADLAQGTLTNYLLELIKSKGLSEKKANEAFVNLTTPKKKSFFQQEEAELLKIISELNGNELRQCRENKNPKNIPPKILDLLQRHAEKWEFLGYSFLGVPLSAPYFFEQMKGMIHQKEDNKSETDSFVPVNLSSEERNLFSDIAELAWVKDYRKAALMHYYYTADKLSKRMAELTAIKYEDTLVLQESEFKAALEGKLPKDIEERRKHCLMLITEGKMPAKIITGDLSREIISHLKRQRSPLNDVFELRGQVAYPGIVEGRVKIIKTAKENDLVKEGDVLVSQMTYPELLPAMKRAAAFVTDTGGITCHAAIVAREMKKPGIVGTKNSTRIFKDGDLVEVNAFHGTIRKIKG